MTHTLTLPRGTILAGTAHFTTNPDGTVDVWEMSSNTGGGMGGKFTVEKAREHYRKLAQGGWKKSA
jgi:hypothetical protein